MLSGSVGQILLNDVLPPDLRDYGATFDKKGIAKLYQALSEKYPDRFAAISKQLQDLSRQAAYRSGGFSFDIGHLKMTKAAQEARQRLRNQVQQILADKEKSDDEKQEAIREAVDKERATLSKRVYDEALHSGNPLAMQVATGARGNPTQLSSLVGLDLLYEDAAGNTVPFPILKNFSEGLSPAEYFASAFGARKGVVDVKLGTARGGYLAKQLSQLAHRLLVTQLDDEDEDPDNPTALPGGVRGLPVDVDDDDNVGALLARETGPYPRNLVLNPRTLADLKNRGFKRILVRSPAVGGPGDGVYARDVGLRERGRLPPLGDMVGITASQALCLAAGTRVRMADGSVKPIEQIQPGDMVLGCNLAGVTRPTRVVQLIDNGVQPCVETVFSRGTGNVNDALLPKLRSTVNHKLLAVLVRDRGSKIVDRRPPAAVIPLNEVRKRRDRFFAKLPQGFDDSGLKAEPYALLAGLLLGDGCYTGGHTSNGIVFTCFDTTLIADIGDYVASLGLTLTPNTYETAYRLVDPDRFWMKQANTGELVRNRMRLFLVNEGMWGQNSLTKVLPASVAKWSNAAVAQLLCGLFATDGWVHVDKYGNPLVGFSSSSQQLIRGIEWLLAYRFGVYATDVASSVKKRQTGDNYAPNYKLVIAKQQAVRKFADAIGRIPGVKGVLLAAALAAKPLGKKAAENGRCPFRSMESIGNCQTYDLEVEHPDHLFVLENWLVVHNSEKITQSALSSKHSAGVKGAAPVASGFKYIDALLQAPETMPGAAAHAQLDGYVERVAPAPAGGSYVFVNGQQHYVPGDQTLSVKPGDQVEAGDTLSNGIPHPAEVVKHKGIGEGRRYFINKFREVLKNSGAPGHRRNIELIARGLMDHVEMLDESDDYLPGDVMSYQQLERKWRPREGFQAVQPSQAVGRYLERPVLHYSIGTKIRKHMLPEFEEFGVQQIDVHDDPPPFQPAMVRAMENLQQDQDWLARLLGGQQRKSLLEATHRGMASDTKGTSYVPALAVGKNFGTDWPQSVLKGP